MSSNSQLSTMYHEQGSNGTLLRWNITNEVGVNYKHEGYNGDLASKLDSVGGRMVKRRMIGHTKTV